jgi:hypothetical protein
MARVGWIHEIIGLWYTRLLILRHDWIRQHVKGSRSLASRAPVELQAIQYLLQARSETFHSGNYWILGTLIFKVCLMNRVCFCTWQFRLQHRQSKTTQFLRMLQSRWFRLPPITSWRCFIPDLEIFVVWFSQWHNFVCHVKRLRPSRSSTNIMIIRPTGQCFVADVVLCISQIRYHVDLFWSDRCDLDAPSPL